MDSVLVNRQGGRLILFSVCCILACLCVLHRARNVSTTHGDCKWRKAWNGYQCSGIRHAMLVIESRDADTEVRRLSPLAIRGGDTGSGKYIDLLNGPMDHGKPVLFLKS